MTKAFGDVAVSVEGWIATAEIRRPPDNFFDVGLIEALADAYDWLGADTAVRAVVLCSEGKNFCAGADFAGRSGQAKPVSADGAGQLYEQAARLFETPLPVVAAVQGAAVGGGLGLACSADFRVASSSSRFSANFSRLGLHQGFGLSVTLPEIVGRQAALDLLLTGRRVGGEEAAEIGLIDRLVVGDVREAAFQLAVDIAEAAPLAVRAIRATMRAGLADRFRAATAAELAEQDWLRRTADFAEGVRASAERRRPRFEGR